MRKLNAVLVALLGALAVAISVAATQPSDPPHPFNLDPCPTEDSGVNCVWDAQSRGNGKGRTFWVDWSGRVHYLGE